MIDRVSIHERISEGLIRVNVNGEVKIWTKRKLRKPNECWLSGKKMKVGDEAYGPIGNQMYRFKRISARIVERDKT